MVKYLAFLCTFLFAATASADLVDILAKKFPLKSNFKCEFSPRWMTKWEFCVPAVSQIGSDGVERCAITGQTLVKPQWIVCAKVTGEKAPQNLLCYYLEPKVLIFDDLGERDRAVLALAEKAKSAGVCAEATVGAVLPIRE